jgi:4-hydroxybenzoate polyprenyltransferase
MKKAFLIGNIHVAILTALVLINTALFDIIPNIHFPGNESGGMILKIILVYALFSFLLTLIREFVKDIEDKEGDSAINSHTLAIVLGIRKTKIIVFCLSFLVAGIVGFWQYFQLQIISLNNVKWDGEIYLGNGQIRHYLYRYFANGFTFFYFKIIQFKNKKGLLLFESVL